MSVVRLHSFGPVHHFVRFRGEALGLYLGTAEVSPRVDVTPYTLGVMNDLAGRQTAYQDVDDGEEHAVASVLNNVDIAVFKRVRDRVDHLADPNTHGFDDRHRRGSMVRGYGDFQLILIYEFTGVLPAHPQADVDMQQGRIYASCPFVAYREDASKTRITEYACTFLCKSLYNPGLRGFQLYSEKSADFGTLAPIQVAYP